MSYEEEKKYLVSKAKEFLGNEEVVWLEDVKGSTDYLTLNYFGKPLEVELVGLELDNEVLVGSELDNEVSVRTYSEEYPDGADSSYLAEFSNDEIKKILELFGIDY